MSLARRAKAAQARYNALVPELLELYKGKVTREEVTTSWLLSEAYRANQDLAKQHREEPYVLIQMVVLNKYPTKKLKELLKAEKLSSSGNKRSLVGRLIKFRTEKSLAVATGEKVSLLGKRKKHMDPVETRAQKDAMMAKNPLLLDRSRTLRITPEEQRARFPPNSLPLVNLPYLFIPPATHKMCKLVSNLKAVGTVPDGRDLSQGEITVDLVPTMVREAHGLNAVEATTHYEFDLYHEGHRFFYLSVEQVCNLHSDGFGPGELTADGDLPYVTTMVDGVEHTPQWSGMLSWKPTLRFHLHYHYNRPGRPDIQQTPYPELIPYFALLTDKIALRMYANEGWYRCVQHEVDVTRYFGAATTLPKYPDIWADRWWEAERKPILLEDRPPTSPDKPSMRHVRTLTEADLKVMMLKRESDDEAFADHKDDEDMHDGPLARRSRSRSANNLSLHRSVSLSGNLNSPTAMEGVIEQPPDMLGVRLYGYQLDALRWMLDLEHQPVVFRLSCAMGAERSLGLPKYTVFDVRDPSHPRLVAYQSAKMVPERCLREILGREGINDEIEDGRDEKVEGDWKDDDAEKSQVLLEDFCTRGGIFADEMGLGKTQTVIGLILSQKRQKSSERSSSMIEHTSRKKRGFEHHPSEIYSLQEARMGYQRVPALREVRATLVFCPGHLVDQWRRELIKATVRPDAWRRGEAYAAQMCPLTIVVIKTLEEYRELTYLEIVEADVVVASFDAPMHDAYDPRNPGEEDISEKRANLLVPETREWVGHEVTGLFMAKELENDSHQPRGTHLSDTLPKPHHFGWHRVIIDEGQECLMEKKFFATLLTSFFWYVTGSPFPKEQPAESMDDVLRLLDVRSARWDWQQLPLPTPVAPEPPQPGARISYDYMLRKSEYEKSMSRLRPVHYQFQAYMAAMVHDGVREHLFWRNTKTSPSVTKSHTLPPVIETVEWCSLTAVERALYQAAEENYLVLKSEAAAQDLRRTEYNRLVEAEINIVESALLEAQAKCCHPQATFADRRRLGVERKSIFQIRTELYLHAREAIKSAQLMVQVTSSTSSELVASIEELESLLGVKNLVDRDVKELQLRRAREELAAARAQRESAKRVENQMSMRLKFLEEVMPKLDEALQEPCSVCWEEMLTPAVTVCGHVFCHACIKTVVRGQRPCPMCRAPLSMADIKPVAVRAFTRKVAPAAQEEMDPETAKKLKTLSLQYGSKLARLIMYLERHASEDGFRAIVFSQWTPMLTLIGEALNRHGIGTVCCTGHVQERNRTIRAFKSGAAKVILLSSQKSASGLNLTEATHVVMMDVASKPELARVVDAQAIARAHRIGQTKPVNVLRLVARDTLEESFYHNAYTQDDADGGEA